MQTATILNQEFSYEELQERFNLPKDAIVEGCNAIATDSTERLKALDFRHFISMFPIDGFSVQSHIQLQDLESLFDDPFLLFDSNTITESNLRSIGFGPSQSKSFVKGMELWKSKGIDTWRIIRALSINGAGGSTCKQFARFMAGKVYSFDSKTKAIIQELHDRHGEIESNIQRIKDYGFKINLPQDDVEPKTDAKKYLLTGSPKGAGFSTKEIFKKEIPNWVEVGNIKLADILITDDLDSKSSKTSAAKKLGKQIITYSQAIEQYKTEINE